MNIFYILNLNYLKGGEDDDLRKRVVAKNLNVSRAPLDIGRYMMAKHKGDSLNKANPIRFRLLKTSEMRVDIDGLTSVEYEVTSLVKRRLFTTININYEELEITKKYMD